MPHSVANKNQPPKTFVVRSRCFFLALSNFGHSGLFEPLVGTKTESSNHVMLERWVGEKSRKVLPFSEITTQLSSA